VTEDRARAAGQDCRHPPAFIAELAVPDRINTAMNAVKAAGGNATRNTGWGKAG
jgi:hypothetical protein